MTEYLIPEWEIVNATTFKHIQEGIAQARARKAEFIGKNCRACPHKSRAQSEINYEPDQSGAPHQDHELQISCAGIRQTDALCLRFFAIQVLSGNVFSRLNL